MKKIFAVCTAALLIGLNFNIPAYAEETVPVNPYDWQISMQPQPTAEEIEEARWTLILENNIGVYAYDTNTLKLLADNVAAVEVKTVFTDKEILKNLQKQYKKNLHKGEKAVYCKMLMQFNLVDKTYLVKQMDVYSDEDRVLSSKVNNAFTTVPKGTFAEAVYEICSNFAEQQNTAK